MGNLDVRYGSIDSDKRGGFKKRSRGLEQRVGGGESEKRRDSTTTHFVRLKAGGRPKSNDLDNPITKSC
jgi:hypothetical protein